MNPKIILYTVGKAVVLVAAIMLAPMLVSIYYGESIAAFLYTIAAALVIGFAMVFLGGHRADRLSVKDGYVIVTLAWIGLSLIGALPFYISGEIPSYVDAFFEAVSGFTTTGASILTDVESMGRGLLFWRSFTHWIGGMGVLVFIMALAERNPNSSINLMKAEMPGSRVDKLTPKAKGTAKILYNIYIVMTLIEILLLLLGGMPLYDSVVHALGTAGTGGFGIYADSIGGYSAYLQYVIAIFMMLFGVNFGIYYLILKKRWSAIFKSTELKWFLAIIGIATAIIVIANQQVYSSLAENLRYAFFQVTSIISTTGYSTTDFNAWPEISKAVLFVLMFIGGCEGSTAGGLKVARIMTMSSTIKNEMTHSLHPRMVGTLRIGGKNVSTETINSIGSYIMLYVVVGVTAFFIISLDNMGFESSLTAVVSCLNNIGPGLAKVGPAASFAEFSDVSKVVLSITMLLGRLEIYPILLTVSRER